MHLHGDGLWPCKCKQNNCKLFPICPYFELYISTLSVMMQVVITPTILRHRQRRSCSYSVGKEKNAGKHNALSASHVAKSVWAHDFYPLCLQSWLLKQHADAELSQFSKWIIYKLTYFLMNQLSSVIHTCKLCTAHTKSWQISMYYCGTKCLSSSKNRSR